MDAKNKIMNSFYELHKPKLYYNEIKEFSKLSHSSLQNALKKLVETNILEEEKTKSNKFYILKNKKVCALYFSQIAIQKFNNLNIQIKNPLNNFLKNMPHEIFSIILFGSASKNDVNKESDIDILIVSNQKINLEKNKEEAELTSTYPISIFFCNIKEFIEHKDPVILQAKKTGFPIYKEQNFFEVQLSEK